MSVVRFYEWCLCEIDNVFSMSIFYVRFKQSLENPQWFTQGSCGCCFCCFWAFLAPVQNSYLYKAPIFCTRKPPTLNRCISKSTSIQKAHLLDKVCTKSSEFLNIMIHSLIIKCTTVLFKCFHSKLFVGFNT